MPLPDLAGSPLFRYGEELFAAGYFWEAHAVWEELWLTAKRAGDGTGSALLRALIQLAAAALKEVQGNRRGRNKLLGRAEEAFSRAGAGGDLPAPLAERFVRLRARLPS